MGVRVGRCRAFCSLVFSGALLCSVIILWEGGGGAIPNATLSPGKGRRGGGSERSVRSFSLELCCVLLLYCGRGEGEPYLMLHCHRGKGGGGGGGSERSVRWFSLELWCVPSSYFAPRPQTCSTHPPFGRFYLAGTRTPEHRVL